MSYRFEARHIYRMPTHFGPAPGPCQLPGDFVIDPKRTPRRLSVAASFLTDPVVLEQSTRRDSNTRMSLLHRFIVLLQIYRRCLRDRRELAAMDDRLLRDIGLTRYDVELELRKPFWRGLFDCRHQC
jgi:uncharacterized protein YjiS (DUF1127 family)